MRRDIGVLTITNISDLVHVVLGQTGAVERILRDGDHHARPLPSPGTSQQLQTGSDTLGEEGEVIDRGYDDGRDLTSLAPAHNITLRQSLSWPPSLSLMYSAT